MKHIQTNKQTNKHTHTHTHTHTHKHSVGRMYSFLMLQRVVHIDISVT